MIRKMMCMAVVVLLMGGDVLAAPKKRASMGRVAKVVSFPVVHPTATLKGIAYGALHVVGTVVDSVEYVTDEIAKGVAKVDGAVDTLEGQTNPAPSGATSGQQHTNPATP